MVSICSLPSRRRSLLFGDGDVLFKEFEPPRFGGWKELNVDTFDNELNVDTCYNIWMGFYIYVEALEMS